MLSFMRIWIFADNEHDKQRTEWVATGNDLARMKLAFMLFFSPFAAVVFLFPEPLLFLKAAVR